MWTYVVPHFQRFLQELELDNEQRVDAESKARRVAACLWKKYYSGAFDPRYLVLIGSYGKQTSTDPPSDLDMLFLLPPEVYWRIEALVGNKQSQLLREVKETLEGTFPFTDLRADRHVVIAPFETYSVEVVPAFLWTDGTYRVANTANGGSWRVSNPAAELQQIDMVVGLPANLDVQGLVF